MTVFEMMDYDQTQRYHHHQESEIEEVYEKEGGMEGNI